MKQRKTLRAKIRPFQRFDIDDLFLILNDPEIVKFTGFKTIQSYEQTEKLLNKWIKEGELELGVWAAETLDSKKLIGWFMLKMTNFNGPELGFMLTKPMQGKGFATEIGQALLNYAFLELKQKQVMAVTSVDNDRSIHVLKKLGMHEIQIADQSELHFSISADDFEAH